jgi:acyl-coenzyme A thioesterase PaaI-like protein
VLDALGRFFRHESDPLLIGLLVDEHKVNARGFLHAGVLAIIADVTIGHALARSTDPPTNLLTVNLSCDYTGVAEVETWVDGTIGIARVGRRLAVGTITFTAAGRAIGSARGLFLPA